MAKPVIFTHPRTKEQITIPNTVTDETGKILTVTDKKKLGLTPGGWYVDKAGKEFMVKFDGSPFCYLEKLINDLARICVGEQFVPERVAVGHGEFRDQQSPCLISAKIEGYQDLIAIPDIATRKSHARNFHRFYAFNALLTNDDLNEENLGMRDTTPFIVDYGALPRFLHEEQAAYSATPFHLASFIGHRHLAGMQLVRRRYFGHDDFLDPSDRLKPQKSSLKPEDISYLSVLNGVCLLVDNRTKISNAILGAIAAINADGCITVEQKQIYESHLNKIEEVLANRIGYMTHHFAEDLKLLSDPKERERFEAVKWRLHPEFAKLMRFDMAASKEMARVDLKKNLKEFCGEKLMGRSRDECLGLDLIGIEKSDLQNFATQNFMLHNSIAAGDFEMAKWLAKNDLVDPNVARLSRTHNYHLFNLTPLNAAIATYMDALYYEDKEKQEPLLELISVLREKFFEKNGATFDPNGPYNPVKLTFIADKKLNEALENRAATKIQRAFRAHHSAPLTTSAAVQLDGGSSH